MKKFGNFYFSFLFFNCFFLIAPSIIQLTAKKEKIKKEEYFKIFSERFFKNICKKSKDPKKTQIGPIKTEKSEKSYLTNKKFESFISLLMLIVKFLRNLKMRTSNLRKIKYVNERSISLINDCSYFQENHKNENNSMLFKSRFLRKKFRQFKIFFIHLRRFLSNSF